MKYYLPTFIILVCIATATEMAAKTFDPDVSHWIEIERPQDSSSPEGGVFYYASIYSDLEWYVKVTDGRILASLKNEMTLEKPGFTPKAKRFKGGEHFQKVDDGWLVAFNQGEFGAELWWFSRNGTSSYKISNDQINQFIVSDGNIYAIEGLAHMGMSRGSFIKIIKQGGQWISLKQIAFDESPEAIMQGKNEFLFIVLTDSMIRLDKGLNVTKIVKNSSWGGLYPHSIASNDPKFVYIGMRQFVVQINLNDGKTKYLIPEMKFLNKLSPEVEKRVRQQYAPRSN